VQINKNRRAEHVKQVAGKTSKFKLEVLRKKTTLIYLLALTTFVSRYSFFYGEDIVNARNNYLTGPRIDFWGGISTLVYSHIPSFGLRWQVWLAILQLLLTALGLQKLLNKENGNLRWRLMELLGIYSAFQFSSQMTRDGLMFSVLIYGIALLSTWVSAGKSQKTLLAAFLVITLGMSFRPWLSIAIIPVMLLMLNHAPLKLSRVSKIALVVALSVTPLLTEYSVSSLLSLNKSYPEQQVMLMDTAASYCYTNNTSTGARARDALGLFVTDSKFSETACQLFRPDTWVSLTKGGNTSSEGIKNDFSLIQPGDQNRYMKLRGFWLEMITSDPITYLQNKTIFAGKIVFGSDSRNLSDFGQSSGYEKVFAVYRFPYEIAIILHMYSLLAGILLLILLPIIDYVRRKSIGVVFDSVSVKLITAMTLWLWLSSIAYIGSNGRYTYTISIISFLLYISHRIEIHISGQKNA
jgi:hypothetical protein